jgi:hypothetical protein
MPKLDGPVVVLKLTLLAPDCPAKPPRARAMLVHERQAYQQRQLISCSRINQRLPKLMQNSLTIPSPVVELAALPSTVFVFEGGFLGDWTCQLVCTLALVSRHQERPLFTFRLAEATTLAPCRSPGGRFLGNIRYSLAFQRRSKKGLPPLTDFNKLLTSKFPFTRPSPSQLEEKGSSQDDYDYENDFNDFD